VYRPSAHHSEQAAAYEHFVNLTRKEKERKRKPQKGRGSVGGEKGTGLGGVYQELGGLRA